MGLLFCSLSPVKLSFPMNFFVVVVDFFFVLLPY